MVSAEVIKQPRGFIKILETFCSLLAFSTTTSFTTYFSFHAKVNNCLEPGHEAISYHVSYPFDFSRRPVFAQLCLNPNIGEVFHFDTDASPHAKFFVTVGVFSMLYSLFALVGYVLLGERIITSACLHFGDLFVSVLILLLWMSSASYWASGATDLKFGTDPHVFIDDTCDNMTNVSCMFLDGDAVGHFAKLNISLIFGFLNVLLWATNVWFFCRVYLSRDREVTMERPPASYGTSPT